MKRTSKDASKKKQNKMYLQSKYSPIEKFLLWCFPILLLILFGAYYFHNARFMNISERIIDRFSNRRIPKLMIQGVRTSYKSVVNRYNEISIFHKSDDLSKGQQGSDDTKTWYDIDEDLIEDKNHFVELVINETYWAVDSDFKNWLHLRNLQVEQLLHSHPDREKVSDYIICDRYPEMKEVYNELKEEVLPLIHVGNLKGEDNTCDITNEAAKQRKMSLNVSQIDKSWEIELPEKKEKRKHCLNET